MTLDLVENDRMRAKTTKRSIDVKAGAPYNSSPSFASEYAARTPIPTKRANDERKPSERVEIRRDGGLLQVG
jgi:hypothetical protein